MDSWRGLCLVMATIIIIGGTEGQLRENFYSSSCSNVESIVFQSVSQKFKETFVTAQATLRLFFHDCFVEGCDASVMISSANGDAEKDASDNLSLAGDGFDTVVKAKAAVEAVCPGVVSCADILAIAARDVVVLSGGPRFNVELGRRDGLISQASRVAGNLPDPSMNLNQLNTIFSKNSLSQFDMIALSGAHTIGVTHCNRIANRLYNFSLLTQVDPTMDLTYAQQMMQACPRNVDPSIAVNLDFQTPRAFDSAYYQNLINRKGLLASDQLLFNDLRSISTVIDFAGSQDDFYKAFVAAMVKLGRVGVKTGSQGEIRKDCSAFNSQGKGFMQDLRE